MSTVDAMARAAEKVYQHRGWKWGHGAKEHCPRWYEIAETLRELIGVAIEQKSERLETGRLILERNDADRQWRFFLDLGEVPFLEDPA